MNLAADPRLNHRIPVTTGVRADEAGRLLVEFFAARRRSQLGAGTGDADR